MSPRRFSNVIPAQAGISVFISDVERVKCQAEGLSISEPRSLYIGLTPCALGAGVHIVIPPFM
jgi:hypothetical protein